MYGECVVFYLESDMLKVAFYVFAGCDIHIRLCNCR